MDVPQLSTTIICYSILPRLSVKHLLRCRCVCKQWRSLIDNADKHFIDTHLSLSKQKPRILCYDYPPVLHTISADNVSCQLVQTEPFFFLNHPYRISASRDGLVCFRSYPRDDSSLLYVINPATGRSLPLPHSTKSGLFPMFCDIVPCSSPSSGSVIYKVMVIYEKQWGEGVDGELVTLGVDSSWRQFNPPAGKPVVLSPSVYLHGAAHWISKELDDGKDCDGAIRPLPGKEKIAVFDVGEENVTIMGYPKCCRGGSFCFNQHNVCLAEMSGKLHLLHFDRTATALETWVLKDYGRRIWMKRSFLFAWPWQPGLTDWTSVAAIGKLRDEVLLRMTKGPFYEFLVCYNPKLNKYDKLRERGIQLEEIMTGIAVYEESLVSW